MAQFGSAFERWMELYASEGRKVEIISNHGLISHFFALHYCAATEYGMDVRVDPKIDESRTGSFRNAVSPI